MSDGTKFRSALRQLGLALLNATLMLALALTVMVWLTLGRMQGLVDNTQTALVTALAPQAARLERIASGVEGLTTQLDAQTGAPDLRQEVQGLRDDIAAIRAQTRAVSQIGPQVFAQRVLQMIGSRLAHERPSDPE